MTVYAPVSLQKALNARAATPDSCRSSGCTNPWGNSFPEEEMPFGQEIDLGGIPYSMPVPDAASNDHLELRGEQLDLEGRAVSGLAVLGFSEMGERPWHIILEGADGGRRIDFEAPGWLRDPGEPSVGPKLAGSHLHYPGDYELAFFFPTAWPMVARFSPVRATCLMLPPSPLVHLFAITLLLEESA